MEEDLVEKFLEDEKARRETEIALNMAPDTLYVGATKTGGSYMNVKTDEESSVDYQVSPFIKITLFFTKVHGNPEITNITLKKFKKTSPQGEYSVDGVVSFSTLTLAKIRDLLDFITRLDIKGIEKRRIGLQLEPDQTQEEILRQLRTLVSTNEGYEKVVELFKNELITKSDIVGVGYRKQQLEIFSRLLNEDGYLDKYREENEIVSKKDEDVWQHFFKRNEWVFGYGLKYQFLEMVTDQPDYGGGNVYGHGDQRGDFLMKTAADVKFTVLIEIKNPTGDLVSDSRIRSGTYRIASDLVDATSQLQTNIHTWGVIGSALPQNQRIEELPLTHEPRGILVIGRLISLADNKEKITTFESFRRNLINPEIVTYDELFDRASWIVKSSESA